MFSKALYKQSWKANGILWLVITVATCFMLACVMMISGGGNISKMRNSISDTIIDSTIETSMKDRGLNYYEISVDSLEKFDTYFATELMNGKSNEEAYVNAIESLKEYAVAVAESKGYSATSNETFEIQGIIFYVLNPNGQYDSFYTELGETAPVYDLSTIGTDGRSEYINTYAKNNASIFMAGNMIKEENVDKILSNLESYGVDQEKYASFGYSGEEGYKNIKNISITAIITYQAQLDNVLANYDSTGKTAEQIASEQNAIKLNLHQDLTKSFIDTLPQDVSDALSELGEMDMYSMMVGSIFYKMAGLLLPIIYMIMASNSLIAGQVDSGSMAYILSTSTKRKQVTFTQAMYLISSIFLMFVCTFITSCICLHALTISVELTYLDLFYMNLGAFIAMFAMSGICFLASCWFNRSKYSMAVGGGLNMFFLVACMLGLFGSSVMPSVIRMNSLNFFNYTTIISLFDVNSILNGTWTFVWKLAILVVIGVVCYIVGAKKFEKKDLPL